MRNMRKLIGSAVLVALGLIAGIAMAGGDDGLTLDQLPKAAVDALLKLADGATIAELERDQEDGTVVFEAEWTVDGRKVEATVTAEGDLVEYEEEITADQLPPRVAAAVAGAFPTGANEFEKMMVVVYEIEGKVNGKEKEIMVLSTGKIIGTEIEGDDNN